MFRTLLLLGAVATLAVSAASPAFAQGNITTTPFSPGFSPYYYPGYTDLYALNGAANVINAQGQLMVNQQEAFLKREQVRKARIEVRRAELEQFLWEREHMPTAEDDRQRAAEELLRRHRYGSDLTEIWSAKALNALLADARKISSPGAEASAPAISDNVLAKINISSGKGDLGLLKNKINFPLLLKRSDFDKEREHLIFLADKSNQQAQTPDGIKPEIIEDMRETVDRMQQKLSGMAREAGDNANWQPTMYMEGKNFLNQFEANVRALQQPDAVAHLTNKYKLKGNIVEVVRYMVDNGLQFAPATEGSQAAYNALYDLLRSYDEQFGSKLPDKHK
jgi:hypothetical protein